MKAINLPRPAAAIPPAESVVLACIGRAFAHGRGALTNISIAQDCPSLRLDYLEQATQRLAEAMDALEAALAAQRLRKAAGEADGDAGVVVTNEFDRAQLTDQGAGEPGPSIRCNACHDPQTCPQCQALNAARDASFGAPAIFEDASR